MFLRIKSLSDHNPAQGIYKGSESLYSQHLLDKRPPYYLKSTGLVYHNIIQKAVSLLHNNNTLHPVTVSKICATYLGEGVLLINSSEMSLK